MKTHAKERRRSRRHVLICPVTLFGPGDGLPVTTAEGNLSDGGVYLSVPANAVPAVGARVDLTFCVPRGAEGLEVVATGGAIVRRDTAEDRPVQGVAVRFKQPIDLALA